VSTEPPPIGTGLLLRRAHRTLHQALNARFAAHNVSVAGFNVLFVLWHEDGVAQSDVPERVDMDKATLTPIIDTLERTGLIERRQDGQDRRRNNLFLTASGRALEKPLMEVAVDVVAAALYGVSPAELTILRRGLMAVLRNLDGAV
jgi:MarR family transcriptional regulator, organic hydroperoxide resistance regulator